jgi:hypothetical protein
LDHTKAGKDDMRYLVQPRGPGKNWVFRMVTPPDLIGVPNPWDGKPLGREIKGASKPAAFRMLASFVTLRWATFAVFKAA